MKRKFLKILGYLIVGFNIVYLLFNSSMILMSASYGIINGTIIIIGMLPIIMIIIGITLIKKNK